MLQNDITDKYLNRCEQLERVGWDIETSGLNWQTEQIGLCQLKPEKGQSVLIKINRHQDYKPTNLVKLLEDQSVEKVFHHAMFDLRFMQHKWSAMPRNIACTKIAAKLLTLEDNNHDLKTLLKKYLKTDIEKKLRTSNWTKPNISKEQSSYAIKDVKYLLDLIEILRSKLNKQGLKPLTERCFDHIPTRVRLDLLGYQDIYAYKDRS